LIAIPGEKLGVIEAFEPRGDFIIKDGNIYATRLSVVKIDRKQKIIEIKPLRKGFVSVGDIVVGRVDYIQRPFAFVTIVSALNEDLAADMKGMIYVDPDYDYTPVIEGSIVRAKVIGTSAGTLMLSVDEPGLGVLESYCNYCGGPLVVRGRNSARCIWCGRVLRLRLAPDFKSKALPHRVILE
jgi:Predicted RNA-binding protein (consists of S1 domain and a Zn-ribbon domain)